jgi:hypothetical protein
MVCVVHVRPNRAGGWHLGCSLDEELDAKTADMLRLQTKPPPERVWQRLASPIRTTCYVSGSENGALRGVRVENVSRGGIGLEVAEPVPEGACVEVLVPHAKSSLHRVLARVMRVTAQKGNRWFLGCAFLAELSDRELGAFVNASPAADDFKLEKGYTLLFNGQDLTGWEQGYGPQETRPNNEKLHGKTASKHKVFEVAGGLLIATGKALRAVYTSQEYNEPFHLKLECRTAADNGKSASLILRGAELRLYGKNGGGSTNGVATSLHFSEGEWNEIDVTVKPAVVSNFVNGLELSKRDVLGLIVMNGKPTATLNGQPIKLASLQHSASAQALCKCNGQAVGKPLTIPAIGAIGLQAQSKFEFRRIRIKELS